MIYFQITQHCAVHTVQKNMKYTILLFLPMLLVFLKLTEAKNNFNYMNDEEMLHLGETFKNIDRLEQRNISQHRQGAAFAIDSNGYFKTTISGVTDLIDIYNNIRRMTLHYNLMRRFETNRFEDTTQIDMAQTQVTTEEDQNLDVMEKIHRKLFGSDDLIGLLARGNQLQIFTCKTPQSPQQFLYTLYVEYVILELKAHAMVEWSWMFLRKFGKGGSLEEEKASREAYKRRTPGTLPKIKALMSQADRSVWRCDPREHKSRVTYEEITRLMQGYVENEVDLNTDGTCSPDCGFYKSSKNEGCFDKKFCSEQPKCAGGVYDCRFVESEMQICQAEQSSNRRYQFIQYESGVVHGQKGSCHTWLNHAKSWNRWIFQECSYCACLCDDRIPQSDRYFNLRPVIADVENNRVVTGLRFVKKNRIFHLQIQEGELLPYGVINESTVQWSPVDTYSISDEYVKINVDYHMLTYENRSINLGKVEADNKWVLVVTGLRFQVVGGHLQLEAQFSKIDFENGKLIEPTTSSIWISEGNDKPREKLSLKDVRVPTQSPVPSIPYPSDNQYIEFASTGFEHDAAQTTVPFIDIQEVVSEPAVPLSGIGVHYKGRDGYGGFLAPKIITYDFTPYVYVPTWGSLNSKKPE
ncbi:uncharacterized protein LOC108032333 [Drosophila biarmipes]|uniref:uncharacterized protein LOC108032333 n=1 Tax=Drosophila biarmipes TaxID=125945 RepID=UPI001CDA5A3F|nr:uncharacterized protein LOC108032333 [Drosophila biarmipes]